MPELASIPYGQYEPGELSEEDLERVGTFWEDYWTESLKTKDTPIASRYPSFEMWAAMTSYDRNAADGTGGAGFQNLMRLLLGGLTKATSKQPQNVTAKDSAYISTHYAGALYWDCEKLKYGKMFKTEKYGFGTIPTDDKWFHDVLGDGQPAQLNGKQSSTHSSAHCRPFIPIDKKQGLYWGAVTGTKTHLMRHFGTNFGYSPCSAMDFLVKTNMPVIAPGAKAVNNVGQSYKNVGIGPQKLEDCWEIAFRPKGSEPCMLVRNKIAAYFGLYYYADCRNEKLNWVVYEQLDGQFYAIQMRCINPKYGRVDWYADGDGPFEGEKGDKLFIREPLNPLNKKSLEQYKPPSKMYITTLQVDRNFVLKHERNFDHLGGKNPGDEEPESKFEIPRIDRKADKHTHSPWGALVDKEGFTLVQPLWDPKAKDNKWYLQTGAGRMCFLHHQRLRELNIKSVGEPIEHNSGQFGFGFKVPAAFLMWPCYIHSKQTVLTAPPATSKPAPDYMTEPKLATNIDTIMATLTTALTLGYLQEDEAFENFVVVVGKDIKLKLGRLLLNYDEYETLGKDAWRLKLLGFSTKAPLVQAPPVVAAVQEADAPQDEGESSNESERDGKSSDGSDGGSSLEDWLASDDEEVSPKIAMSTSTRPKRTGLKKTIVEKGGSDDEESDEPQRKVRGKKAIAKAPVKKTKAPVKKPPKADKEYRPGDADGFDYDSDQEKLGGDEKEEEGVTNLMDTVLEQYAELKQNNDLGEGSLEKDYPGLDENPELAKAIRTLIGRSKRLLTPPSGKYIVLYQILTFANLLRNKLEAGRVEPKESEENCHFKEERLQPFRYQSIYDEGRLNFQYEDVDSTAQEGFAEVHGREEQTYAVNGKTAQVVKGYEPILGHARDGVLDSLISDERFRNDYLRIIAIYFSRRGIGTKKVSFDAKEKRIGMLTGLWRHHETGPGLQDVMVPRWIKKGKTGRWDLNYTTKKPTTQVWPPVFKGWGKTTEIDGTELEKIVGEVAASAFGMYFLDQTDAYWGKEEFKGIKLPESDMTIRQWVTTPWHLQHLPYQVQYAVFRDGEAFCEGCKRCSRPFFEFEHLLYSVNKPYLTTALWRQKDDAYGHKARVPIHDPQFNLQEPGKALSAAEIGYLPKAPTNHYKRSIPVIEGSDIGELGYINDGQNGGGADPSDELNPAAGTYNFRMVMLKKESVNSYDLKKSIFADKQYVAEGIPFRKYASPVYLEERTHMYKGVPNGYMLDWKTFGRPDYRVVRSHKFGNTCRDCQYVLQTAPGLFEQNNRYDFGPQEPRPNTISGKTDPSVKFPRENTYDKLFRPAAEQQKDDEPLDDTLERIRAALAVRNKLPPGWTKIVEVDIAINRDPRQSQKPDQNTKKAEEDLAALLTGHTPIDPNWLNNPALRRSLEQLKNKFTQTRQTERVQSATGRFETGIQRHEYRNCIVRYKFSPRELSWINPPPELCEGTPSVRGHVAEGPNGDLKFDGRETEYGGCPLPGPDAYFGKYTEARLGKVGKGTYQYSGNGIYYNCLITRQFDPVNDPSPTKTKRYRVDVYLCTIRGDQETKSVHIEQPPGCESQWKGDQYVLFRKDLGDGKPEYFRDAGVPWYQLRELVQSRFFITYSLHRPVNGKREGEDILLKMSSAVSALFGNDEWLSSMLVFGKKLARVQITDNVGNVKWVPIEKANKSEKVFHGGRKSNKVTNSYEYDTFDTHVVEVELDGGVEIGPRMGHPHFHLLLTMTHFTYLQFDYYSMKLFLEIMFKGQQTWHGFPPFMLGTPTDPFYGDNENPYVDLRLYPADNFLEVLHKYVRKNDALEKVSSAITQRFDKRQAPEEAPEDEAPEDEAPMQGMDEDGAPDMDEAPEDVDPMNAFIGIDPMDAFFLMSDEELTEWALKREEEEEWEPAVHAVVNV